MKLTSMVSRDEQYLRKFACILLTVLFTTTGLLAATLPSPSQSISLRPFVDMRGTSHDLARAHPDSVFVFLATDCPVSSRTAPRIARLALSYTKRGVAFYTVYSNATETPAAIQRHARDRGLTAAAPIVQDAAGEIARALNVTATPEAVVIDTAGTVRYRGRIDDGDAVNPIRRRDLALALDAVLAGKPVAVPETRAVGCLLRLRPVPEMPPQPPNNGSTGGTGPVANSVGKTPPIIEGLGGPSGAEPSPTYTRDIAPILDRRCVECHRAGEVAPMALDTYAQSASWAKAIKDFTARRTMPPWKADSHGEFLNERRLSDTEIATLAKWADAGAPEGDPADLPKTRPVFPPAGDWKMGAPDAIFSAPNPYTVPSEGRDVYRCFVIPTHYDTDKWVSSIEFQPDNRAVVHHINVFLDLSGKARQLAAADAAPGTGYFSPSPGNIPGFVSAGVLGGWLPGHSPWQLPDGVGNLLPRGADIVLEVHYITDGKPEKDQSRFGIRFVRGPVRKRLRLGEVTARDFRIPAGAHSYQIDTSEFVRDNVSLLSVTPHMHNLGRTMTATAEFPDGTSLRLVSVPDWDFAWQMSYRFKEPVHLPRDTRIDVTATYDNSADNPKNPHKPPQDVRDGENTSSEMCNLFVAYTLDDEDLTKQ